MAVRMTWRSSRRTASLAATTLRVYMGTAIAARMEMIIMTMRSSKRVKPGARFEVRGARVGKVRGSRVAEVRGSRFEVRGPGWGEIYHVLYLLPSRAVSRL